MTEAIRQNKQHLSDIDGQIGDGDHGINMNKGFSLAEEESRNDPGDLANDLKILSNVLISRIGGSMGPLYGMFFRSMAGVCEGQTRIDAGVFGEMIRAAVDGIRTVSAAKVGDKTLMDVLVPADRAYQQALGEGRSFGECLDAMTAAAEAGRDSTEDMLARVGRSSRLGERSRGVVDAGAASSCLILATMAGTIKKMI